jgi:uncharacterized membrane protein YdjX (TVP38/TMEM64 family)
MTSGDDRPRSVRRIVIVLVISGVAVFALWRAGLFSLSDRERLVTAIDRVRDLRYAAPVFVVTYAIGAAVGVPATPLTLAGGALFGVWWGIVFNWLGELLAALLAFSAMRATRLAARRRPLSADAATRALATGRAARTLFRLRLIPVLPFALLNVGAAISGMTWREFGVATALGIIPITVIYTASASALVAGVAGSGARALMMSAISAAVLIGVSFLPFAIGTARKDRQ